MEASAPQEHQTECFKTSKNISRLFLFRFSQVQLWIFYTCTSATLQVYARLGYSRSRIQELCSQQLHAPQESPVGKGSAPVQRSLSHCYRSRTQLQSTSSSNYKPTSVQRRPARAVREFAGQPTIQRVRSGRAGERLTKRFSILGDALKEVICTAENKKYS